LLISNKQTNKPKGTFITLAVVYTNCGNLIVYLLIALNFRKASLQKLF